MVISRDRRDLLKKRHRPIQERRARFGIPLLLLLPMAVAVGATLWYAYRLEARWGGRGEDAAATAWLEQQGSVSGKPRTYAAAPQATNPLVEIGRMLNIAPSAGEQVTTHRDVYRVQLASLKSPQAVENAWRRLRAGHPDLLNGLELTVSQIDLGKKGVFHRLQVGPLASREKADHLCSELTTRQVWCLVIDPESAR